MFNGVCSKLGVHIAAALQCNPKHAYSKVSPTKLSEDLFFVCLGLLSYYLSIA